MSSEYLISGVSLGPGSCAVIASPDDMSAEDPANCLIKKWDTIQGTTTLHCPCPLVDIALIDSMSLRTVALCAEGLAVYETKAELLVEEIAGPEKYGPLQRIRTIGSSMFAVGMGRQVYQRGLDHNWVHCGQGVRNEDFESVLTCDFPAASGLTSLDGNSELNFYSVGLDGQVWRSMNGKWVQLDSPVNLNLEDIRMIGPQTYCACGQLGTLIVGSDSQIQVVEVDGLDEDFASVDIFLGRVFLASQRGMYELTKSKKVVPVETDAAERGTFGRLHAAHGALWSFGSYDAIWTSDGVNWSRADIHLG